MTKPEKMESPVVKHSVIVAGRRTSVTLEDAFWKSLKEIAASRHMTLSALVTAIANERHDGNLSSAVRLFVLNHYQARTSGHAETAEKTSDIIDPRARPFTSAGR